MFEAITNNKSKTSKLGTITKRKRSNNQQNCNESNNPVRSSDKSLSVPTLENDIVRCTNSCSIGSFGSNAGPGSAKNDNNNSDEDDDDDGDENESCDDDDDDDVCLESLITPNFEELARQFPRFRVAYRDVLERQKKSTVSFCPIQAVITQEFTIALCQALLHVHFHGLSIPKIPSLCPPIPNRYYYVHWIQSYLLPMIKTNDSSISSSLYFEQPCHKEHPIKNPTKNHQICLDIGTGATCIYPLLIAATATKRNNNNVIVYATDIDVESIQTAVENVNSNPVPIRNKIIIRHVPPTDIQMRHLSGSNNQTRAMNGMKFAEDYGTKMNAFDNTPMDVRNTTKLNSDPNDVFRIGPLRRSLQYCYIQTNGQSNATYVPVVDFAMTNPPFYDVSEVTAQDMLATEAVDEHQQDLSSAFPPRHDGRIRTAMKESEGYYPNGEVGFVTDMIVDGLYLHLMRKRMSSNDKLGSDRSILPPVPGWSTSMIGKKSSLILLQHILEQFLGYGHVTTTEYGPGNLARWFIAWTFHVPKIRSPMTKLYIRPNTNVTNFNNKNHSPSNPTEWKFQVKFDNQKNDVNKSNPGENETCKISHLYDVVRRVQEYCQSFRDCQLQATVSKQHRKCRLGSTVVVVVVEIREVVNHSTTIVSSWPGDDALPDRFRKILNNGSLSPNEREELFLPNGSHFLIDVILTIYTNTNNSMTSAPSIVRHGVDAVQVHVDAYRHSSYGMKIIQTIKNQFDGEICRTNRRWRRKTIQRHQDQHQLQSQAMDES